MKCRKKTENKNSCKSKKGKPMLLSKRAVCCSIKSRTIEEQRPTELLGSLGIKTTLGEIPLLAPLLF